MNTTQLTSGFSTKIVLIFVSVVTLGYVIISLTVNQQTAQERDMQRLSDMNMLGSSIVRRLVDNRGVFEGVNLGNGKICPKIPETPVVITTDTYSTFRSVGLDCLVTTYLQKIPLDPSTGKGINTGYKIYQDSGKKVHLIAETKEPTIPRNDPIVIIK